MKYKFNRGILIIVAICFIQSLYSQITNSDKNTVLNLYNASGKALIFSGGETAFTVRIPINKTLRTVVGRPAMTGSEKIHNLFIKLGVTNTEKFIDLDEFSFKENNGLSFGLQYRYSIDKIFLLPDNFSFNLTTVEFGADYKYDKFNFYDVNLSAQEVKTPEIGTANVGINRYFFFLNKNLISSLSFNALYRFVDYNEGELANFADLDKGTLINSNILKLSEFSGKVGTLNENVTGLFLSFSIPIIADYEPKFFPIVVPVPHISYHELSHGREDQIKLGFSFGFLSEKLFSDPKTDGAGNNIRTFNNPSFLSVGVDWNLISGDKRPNWFITGTIKY